MRILHWTIAVALVGLTAAHSAAASTLTSPYIWAQTTEMILCTVVNVGTTPIATVTMDLVELGVSTHHSSCPNLAPGIPCYVYGSTGENGYCKVVTNAPKGKVRAVANVRNASDDLTNYALPIN